MREVSRLHLPCVSATICLTDGCDLPRAVIIFLFTIQIEGSHLDVPPATFSLLTFVARLVLVRPMDAHLLSFLTADQAESVSIPHS